MLRSQRFCHFLNRVLWGIQHLSGNNFSVTWRGRSQALQNLDPKLAVGNLTRVDKKSVLSYVAVLWDTARCLAACCTLVSCSANFRPWRWRLYDPPKRRSTYRLHGTISQKMATFITTAVRTSNLKYCLDFNVNICSFLGPGGPGCMHCCTSCHRHQVLFPVKALFNHSLAPSSLEDQRQPPSSAVHGIGDGCKHKLPSPP
jgi:hypothetical protein